MTCAVHHYLRYLRYITTLGYRPIDVEGVPATSLDVALLYRLGVGIELALSQAQHKPASSELYTRRPSRCVGCYFYARISVNNRLLVNGAYALRQVRVS